MKLAVVTELPKEHFAFWEDGLYAALKHLTGEYAWEIDVFNLPSMQNPQIKTQQYDFGLYWGALNRSQHGKKIFKKSGLCYGGGPISRHNTEYFDIVFTESARDLDAFKKLGVNATKAFGTNTDLFKPMESPVVFDSIYPAAFAKWKRHDLFVEYVTKSNGTNRELPSVAIGYMQPNEHEKECYEVCTAAGVLVVPWIPSSSLVYLYNGSRQCVVAADPEGGGQRTVLEAKACDVPVVILNKDHQKLMELDSLTHRQVLEEWSHINYAEQLKKGIESVL